MRRRTTSRVDGELVMERFRLLERIGSGGMGTVYRAFDERLQRDVAIKEVDCDDPARVLREAQAAARLNHPGIVTLYELGEREGRALLVSELVPGTTLARAVWELSDREIGELGSDLCEALAHAHARGVVHRDLKPQNVIVRDDERGGRRAKLMDFGIARLSGAPTLTDRGEVVGTLAYMSPEQAEGELAGPASDVYSLALTLYECWSGTNPVAADSPAETARRIGAGVSPLGELRPDLPAALADTVDACLDPDPPLRPAALELRDAIDGELDALDARRPAAPVARADFGRRPRDRARVLRILTPVAAATMLVALAGPLGVAGAALVLAILLLPPLVAAPGLAAATAPLGSLFAALGIATAAPALCALARRPLERALLGAFAWAWALAAAIAFGAGPELAGAPAATGEWSAEATLAAREVLAPLLSPSAIAGAGLFALASLALGFVLAARHPATALLGALLWAAVLDTALGALTPELGGRPLAAALAAAAAVALEFGVTRARHPPLGAHPAHPAVPRLT